jgi:hypothetical protein
MFDDISARWPELGQRLSYWETGELQPDLTGVAAVLFLLQDPLRELYPECFRDAVTLADRARQRGARIINAPESLSNTIKSTQSRLWRQAGLPTPACIPFNSIEELHAVAATIAGPMILKSDTQHAQARMLLVNDLQQLRSIPRDRIALPGSLSPLIDTRCGFKELDPRSPYATHYHKKRAMVFGDRVRANHVFFATQPIVGSVSSTFGHYRSLNPIRRTIGNARCRRHIECDLAYHDEPCRDTETLVTAARVLGVEFCAIDYSTFAEGGIVLWEVNPYFALHQWPVGVLSRARKLRQRTPHIHETAAMFFHDLLGDAT